MRICIAHRGVTSHGHAYSEEALQAMAAGMVGRMVQTQQLVEDHVGPPLLNSAIGVVTGCEYVDGKVLAEVRWFTGVEVPRGQYLCPCGTGTKKTKADEITGYTPEMLVVAEQSAFSMATKVE